MLTHKPRVGEKLIYDTTTSYIKCDPREFTVTRFDENLMYYLNEQGEQDGPIIWRFKDGLNKCLSHKEKRIEETPCSDCTKIEGEWVCIMNCSPRSVSKVAVI